MFRWDVFRWIARAGITVGEFALGRAAEDEVKAGRMTVEDASSAVHHSFLRLFGLHDHAPG